MISDEYIMGFIEGEGCFSISLGRYVDGHSRKTNRKNKLVKKNKALPFVVKPSFRVGVSVKDKFVLEQIKERFGFGGLHLQKRSKKPGNRQDHVQFYVSTCEHLYLLADYFKKQRFYTTKGNDFKLWAECLDIIKSKRHLKKEGFIELCKLRAQMNPVKNKRDYHNLDEILRALEAFPDEKQAKLIHNKNLDSCDSDPSSPLSVPEPEVASNSAR